jgi:hypothetical protein
MSEGQIMLGASESFTVTVKLQVAVRPGLSVAVQFTIVVPFGKVEPDGGLQTSDVAFVAVTIKVTLLREHWPGLVLKTRFDEHVMLGPDAENPV